MCIRDRVSVALIALSAVRWVPGPLGARGTALLAAWRAEFTPRRLVGCFGVFIAVFLYAKMCIRDRYWIYN